MAHRLLPVVSALALLWGFVSAPYDHLHTGDRVRHTHVTPHDHGHHHDDGGPASPQHQDESGKIVAGEGILSAGPGRLSAPRPIDLQVGVVTPETIVVVARVPDPEATANSPPAADRLVPRAPPAVSL